MTTSIMVEKPTRLGWGLGFEVMARYENARAFHVTGDCLVERHLYPGDLVIVDWSEEQRFEDGNLVAAHWRDRSLSDDDEKNHRLQLGIFEDGDETITIKPSNTRTHDLYSIDKQDIKTLGRVVWAERTGNLF